VNGVLFAEEFGDVFEEAKQKKYTWKKWKKAFLDSHTPKAGESWRNFGDCPSISRK